VGVRARLGGEPDASAIDAVVPAPFGALGVLAPDGVVRGIVFLRTASARAGRTAAAAVAARQIAAYLEDPRSAFDLPLALEGTPFRRRVWRAIGAIRPGSTRTYGQIAVELGSAPRAVGQACGDNPLPLLIPCHRVVAADGPGGFAHSAAGFHQTVKQWLLAHEARARS
jgi:methylated-DNA-[protein]-cysteine S-methyltransferase